MHAVALPPDQLRRCHADLVAYCERRVPGAGEELAQDTWARLLHAAPALPDDDAVRAYAFTVARRVIVDHHRRRLARPRLTLVVDPPDATDALTPEHDARAHDLARLVDAALADASPEIVAVFHARLHHDTPFAELAAHQGVSINTALGRMHRAVLRIRRALRDAGIVPDEEAPR